MILANVTVEAFFSGRHSHVLCPKGSGVTVIPGGVICHYQELAAAKQRSAEFTFEKQTEFKN